MPHNFAWAKAMVANSHKARYERGFDEEDGIKIEGDLFPVLESRLSSYSCILWEMVTINQIGCLKGGGLTQKKHIFSCKML